MSLFVLFSCNIGDFSYIFLILEKKNLFARALRGRINTMKSIISTTTPQVQNIAAEWYGKPVEPPYEYSFTLTSEGLEFRAARRAPALVHPDAVNGAFRAELWKYDAAEFFIATPDGARYMEFNLSPNGAWWTAVFCAPRQIAPGFENWIPTGVQAAGSNNDNGWSCRALIPLKILNEAGITPQACKLTAAAILKSPDQVFLTTALPCNTQPDFHRPDLWELALLQ